MTRSRSLIVGLDGTWNEPTLLANGKPVGTNVVKFLSALTKTNQVQHYESGVGTRAWEALPGGVYGYGLDKRIRGAYRFLGKRFRDRDWARDENRIFVLGFSRGAYSARRLAGLIAHSGLPVKSRDEETGWEMYVEKDAESAKALKAEGRFFDAPIEMVGVWDTVKATNDRDYGDNVLSANVVAGYHAMAIDERRKHFPVVRWNKEARVTETWFAGVHADVGGGYDEMALSDIALRWMMKAAHRHGLRFRAAYARDKVRPRSRGTIHESFAGIWLSLGQTRRRIRKADAIHKSVKTRLDAVASYQPSNLPADPVYVG
jgi:uncharacterized protein (DUF2235 family)